MIAKTINKAPNVTATFNNDGKITISKPGGILPNDFVQSTVTKKE